MLLNIYQNNIVKYFYQDYKQEKKELKTKVEKANIKSTNLTNEIKGALNTTMDIGDLWQKSDYHTKQKIQQLVYPITKKMGSVESFVPMS